MTYAELREQIDIIRAEYCPQTEEQAQLITDGESSDFCGCSICQLTQALIIAEIKGRLPVTEMPGKAQHAPD